MWIHFDSPGTFAIRVSAGEVNAVSGEPMFETAATQEHRLKLIAKKESVQDYVVTPHQVWLDGIATIDGPIRQFMAMPIIRNSGIEAQLNSLQIELTPIKIYPPDYQIKQLFVRFLTGKIITLSNLPGSTTIEQLKYEIQDKEGIPLDHMRTVFAMQRLENGW